MRWCVWQCADGCWHRLLLHLWVHRALSKVCARCGYTKIKVI